MLEEEPAAGPRVVHSPENASVYRNDQPTNTTLTPMSDSVEKSEHPARTPAEISRDHLLATIDEQVRSGLHVLIVDADTGVGKTTILRAYARRYPGQCIQLELSAASRWAYDPDYVINSICSATEDLLRPQARPPQDGYSESQLGAYYQKLSRRGIRTTIPFLFLVDGLHEIPAADAHIRTRLIELLPLGMPGIVAIVTDSDPRKVELAAKVKAKSWRLPKFGVEESRAYLRPVVPDPDLASEIHRLVGGRPGSLAIAYRLIIAGTPPRDILTNQGTLTDLLAFEWRAAAITSDEELLVLAVIALTRTPINAADVARVTHMDISFIHSLLRRATFVGVAQSGVLSFLTDSARQYAIGRAESVVQRAWDLLMADLAKNSDMPSRYMPHYLKDAGRLEDLLGYLTSPTLLSMAKGVKSLQPLADALDAGVHAAHKLRRDGELFRYALHASAVGELDGVGSRELYVKALMQLDAHDQALDVAEGASTPHNKLMLLASIAEVRRARGQPVAAELVDRIRKLLGDVNNKLDTERAASLATKLFSVTPDEAIHLLKRAAMQESTNRTVDWAIAGMVMQTAIQARAAEKAGGKRVDDTSELRSQIRDPDIERLAAALSKSFVSVTAQEALDQAAQIANARDRLFFLRQWISFSADRDDALIVTHAALKLIVSTTEYSPNARDVLHIARPLRRQALSDLAQECVLRIESMLGDLAERGPTAELYRVRILLAATRYRWASLGGQVPLEDEYLGIHGIVDPAIRAECLARLYASIRRLDPQNDKEELSELRCSLDKDIVSSCEAALAQTAFHEDVVRPIIAALALHEPESSAKLIAFVNTKSRRDDLRAFAVEHMAADGAQERTIAVAIELIEVAETSMGRSACVDGLWRALSSKTMSQLSNSRLLSDLIRTTRRGSRPRDVAIASARALALCAACHLPKDPPIAKDLALQVTDALCGIDAAWEQLDTALEACVIVASHDVNLGRACLERARQVERDRLASAGVSSGLVFGPARLAMSALAGLMIRSSDTSDDLRRVHDVIDNVPSAVMRSQLRSDLAMWYCRAGRTNACAEIVQEKILPEIRGYEHEAPYLFAECVVASADSIYAARASTAMSMFRRLPVEFKDLAIHRAARGKLCGLPASEPFEIAGERLDHLKQEDVEELLELAAMCESDATSSAIVTRVTEGLVNDKKPSMPAQQRSAIAQAINKLASETLPRPGWIQHNGYEVLWTACAKRIKDNALLPTDSIVNAARTISNSADRAYVLSCLARLASRKADRIALIEESARAARTIQVGHDEVSMLIGAVEDAFDLDWELGKRIARDVCKLVADGEHGDPTQAKRRVIDAAYKANSAAAAALAELVDTDQARIAARAREEEFRLASRYQELAARSAVVEHRESTEFSWEERLHLPNATWRSLASLNAERSGTRRPDELRGYLVCAGSMPLEQAYPVYAWVLGNIRSRTGSQQQPGSSLRPFFEAAMSIAEFGATCSMPDRGIVVPKRIGASGAMPLRPNQAREARQSVEEWIRDKVRQQCIVVDRYFGPTDVWVLKAIKEADQECRVIVVGGREGVGGSQESLQDVFARGWSRISDGSPPWTDIVLVECSVTHHSPIHDRWILSGDEGLSLGTSLNSLGANVSEVKVLDRSGVAVAMELVVPYVQRSVRRSKDGHLLMYPSVTLV